MKKLIFVIIISLFAVQFIALADVHDTVWTYNINNVYQVKFTPDDKYLLAVARQSAINMYETETGKIVRSFPAIEYNQRFDISPDGKYLLISKSSTPTMLTVIDLYTGEEIKNIDFFSTEIDDFTYSPDGKSIMMLTKCNTSQVQFAKINTETWAYELFTYPIGLYNKNFYCKFEYSPTGDYIAWINRPDDTYNMNIYLLKPGDMTQPPVLLGSHDNWIDHIKFSPDGKLLAIADISMIKIWDIQTMTVLKTFGSPSQNITTTNFEFSSDSKKLITFLDHYLTILDISNDSAIYIYNSTEMSSVFPVGLIQSDHKGNFIAGCHQFTLAMLYAHYEGTSVIEPVDKSISGIYPNPVSNTATIKIPENLSGKITISIIDIYGRKISQIDDTAETRTREIDVSSLPGGMYFVRIAGKSGVVVYKFVKE